MTKESSINRNTLTSSSHTSHYAYHPTRREKPPTNPLSSNIDQIPTWIRTLLYERVIRPKSKLPITRIEQDIDTLLKDYLDVILFKESIK